MLGAQGETYELRLEVMEKLHQDLGIPSSNNEFVPGSTKRDYHLKIPHNLQEDEEIELSFSVYQGNTFITFYVDEEMSSLYLANNHYEYMSDSKFTFASADLYNFKDSPPTKLAGLFLSVRSGDHDSVFRIAVKKDKTHLAELIEEDTYNFHEVAGQKGFYFYPSLQNSG